MKILAEISRLEKIAKPNEKQLVKKLLEVTMELENIEEVIGETGGGDHHTMEQYRRLSKECDALKKSLGRDLTDKEYIEYFKSI